MFPSIVATSLAVMATVMGAVTASPIAGTNGNPLTINTARGAFGSGRFTYYTPGLGACGQTHSEADLVVALNAAEFDPSTPNGNPNNNPLCGRKIRAHYNGKSVDVTLVDRCPGCGSGDLDLSPTAFSKSFSSVPGCWKRRADVFFFSSF